MSVTMCVFCDAYVDTDYHETCPSCERDPSGEYTFCGDCESFVKIIGQPLKAASIGKCIHLLSGVTDVSTDSESCERYNDAEYN